MDYYVCNSKCVIRIEINDADVPANCSRRDYNVLADIQKTVGEVVVDGLTKIRRKRENIDRKQHSLDHRRNRNEIILHEPFEIPG